MDEQCWTVIDLLLSGRALEDGQMNLMLRTVDKAPTAETPGAADLRDVGGLRP